MRVSKWGNSLAVRLPADLVERLGLKEGEEIEMRISADRRLEIFRKSNARDVLRDKISHLRGTMPKDYRFDRDDANRRDGDA